MTATSSGPRTPAAEAAHVDPHAEATRTETTHAGAPVETTPVRRRALPPMLRIAAWELLLNTGMLFTVMTVARWLFAPDSPLAGRLPGLTPKLVVMGLVVGAIVTAVLGPSFRRRTAGHLNPAVSIGLWAQRLLPGHAVLPFVAAQLLGSLAGVGLGRLVWGEVVAVPVGYAALAPAPSWGPLAVFVVEGAAMGVMMLLVAGFLARPRLTAFMPAVIGACVASVIIFLGPLSGGGANPARQFGPALFAGRTDFLWVYLLAPVAGALLAGALVGVLRRVARRR